MTAWNDLVNSALLGVERRPPKLNGDDSDLLARIPTADSAHALLIASAVAAIQQRAGYEPTRVDFPPEPAAPGETWRVCSRRAQHHLSEMVKDPHRYQALLPEWLARLASKDQRVPVPLLPPLLDLAKKGSDLVPLVALVMGERGRWLVAQNAEWRHIGAVDAQQAWTVIRAEPRSVDEHAMRKALEIPVGPEQHQALQPLLRNRILVSRGSLNTLLDRLFEKKGVLAESWAVQTLQTILPSLAPNLLDQAIDRLDRENAGNVRGLGYVLHLIEFRRSMLRELDRD